MKKASIRDLHIRTSELVRDAAEGAVIVIERRGEPVPGLHPIPRRRLGRRLPGITVIWRRFPTAPADSGRYLEEDRSDVPGFGVTGKTAPSADLSRQSLSDDEHSWSGIFSFGDGCCSSKAI